MPQGSNNEITRSGCLSLRLRIARGRDGRWLPAGQRKGGAAGGEAQRARSSKIEMAMADWTLLLSHANEAAAKETWELPPEELFQRILVQINRSKRDILQDKYNQCKDPACPLQTRSVFIRVLKRIAESFMTCLLQMQSGQNGFAAGGAPPG